MDKERTQTNERKDKEIDDYAQIFTLGSKTDSVSRKEGGWGFTRIKDYGDVSIY